MKMSYRDRMILAILIFVIVILVGGLTIIKSSFEKYTSTQASLVAKMAEKADVDAKLGTKDQIVEGVRAALKNAEKAEEFFLPEMKTYEIDQMLTPIFTANNVKVTGFSTEDAEAEEVDFYQYELFNVPYELGSAADLNTSRLHAMKGNTEYALVVAEEPEELILNVVDLKVSGELEDYFKSVDTIDALDKSIVVRTFGKSASEKGANAKDDSGDEFNIYVYQLAELQEPEKVWDDVKW